MKVIKGIVKVIGLVLLAMLASLAAGFALSVVYGLLGLST